MRENSQVTGYLYMILRYPPVDQYSFGRGFSRGSGRVRCGSPMEPSREEEIAMAAHAAN